MAGPNAGMSGIRVVAETGRVVESDEARVPIICEKQDNGINSGISERYDGRGMEGGEIKIPSTYIARESSREQGGAGQS